MPNKTIEDKLTEGRQYRRVMQIFEARAVGDEGGQIVEGYATTFNQPYDLW